jgi:hypothetical protein
MVSGGNGQRSQCHCKQNQNLSQIKEMVARRHQEKKEGSQKRDKEETQLGSGHQGEGRTPELNSTVQEKNLK